MGLHPNGAIDLSYSDDLGLHWIKGNGGRDLEPNNNQTSLQFGHVEDKQWVAVNRFPGTAFQDHVYAMWTTFNGAAGNGKIRARRLARPRPDLLEGDHDHAPGNHNARHDLRLSVGRQ